jgi:hypothetical protein
MAQVTFGFEVTAKNIVDVGDADAFDTRSRGDQSRPPARAAPRGADPVLLDSRQESGTAVRP